MSKNKVNQPAEQKIVKKAWTPQENETLLKAVANKGNLSLNDVFVNLHPIFLFAVNSEGEFDYLTYTSDFNKSSRNLKKQLLNLFDFHNPYQHVVYQP